MLWNISGSCSCVILIRVRCVLSSVGYCTIVLLELFRVFGFLLDELTFFNLFYVWCL